MQLNLVHPMTVRDGIDAAIATILGISGFLLILAAIGYLAIMLVRAGALVLIIATSPIAAAGLVAEGTRAWFWKALRWFLAALMMAPLSALIFAIGTKLTEGVISGTGDSALPAAVGQAVIGTVLVIIGAFAPLVLFRLLAFVDPGTSSGQSFRTSLDAAGGMAGLLGGRGQGADGGQTDAGSGAATATSGDGSSSQGEADAAAATQSRLATAMGPLGSTMRGLSTAGTDRRRVRRRRPRRRRRRPPPALLRHPVQQPVQQPGEQERPAAGPGSETPGATRLGRSARPGPDTRRRSWRQLRHACAIG